jgi:hypothetical protein
MTIDPEKLKQVLDDRPPFFRTWTGVYAVVLGILGFLVLLFALLTRLLA